MNRLSSSDFATGLIFIAIGACVGYMSWSRLPLGSVAMMGPGFAPLCLSVLLIALGGILLLRAPPVQERINALPWRALLILSLAPILFSLVIEGLGLVPTVMGVAMLAAYASREMKLAFALAVSVGLTAVCLLVFKYGLGLSFDTFGPWLT